MGLLKGTAMATPAISGLCGLVVDYFNKKKYLDQDIYMPSSLLKAMLINSAKTNIEADATSDYGKPDLLSALPLEMNSSFGLEFLKIKLSNLINILWQGLNPNRH
jgi:hypothetical protein